jgi:hypothetical protein
MMLEGSMGFQCHECVYTASRPPRPSDIADQVATDQPSRKRNAPTDEEAPVGHALGLCATMLSRSFTCDGGLAVAVPDDGTDAGSPAIDASSRQLPRIVSLQYLRVMRIQNVKASIAAFFFPAVVRVDVSGKSIERKIPSRQYECWLHAGARPLAYGFVASLAAIHPFFCKIAERY